MSNLHKMGVNDHPAPNSSPVHRSVSAGCTTNTTRPELLLLLLLLMSSLLCVLSVSVCVRACVSLLDM